MMTIAAVLVVTGDEPYRNCLTTLRSLDEVILFTDTVGVLESALELGVDGRLIHRPVCIEAIGADLLAASTADWILLVDPDETLACGDRGALRALLAATPAEIVGYSMEYRFRFLGQPLDHTYRGLRKPKLVRPRAVRWPSKIHALPSPVRGRFADLDESVATIESDLLSDVPGRLARHAHWAAIEVMEGSPERVGVRQVDDVLAQVFREYFSERTCGSDGVAGVLNGLLHLNKSIAGLLFQAAAFGLVEDPPETGGVATRALREAASVLNGERPAG